MVTDVLVAEELSRSYVVAGQQIFVVRRASLRVARNELVAILGRSGSGKSTLLSICGGLDTPDTGWVLVNGTDVTQLSEEQRRWFLQSTVGWVFQAPRLVPLLSAAENVAIAMRIAGEQEEEAMRMTAVALEAVALEQRAHLRADQLSRGERQRVALARALVKAPSLVIADEPTAQLDTATAGEIVSLLHDAARSNVAVVFTTHDEAEAARADRTLVMEDGILHEAGY
ncbi:MAG TPA: ABC transporter ATP-binding protein [Candidatus Dormibacteraeota bacterium]|nr:ABC transporter ATP-binding protein [Candidatus Dormibacteraeota bacterium]